jgi:hypothetical protein
MMLVEQVSQIPGIDILRAALAVLQIVVGVVIALALVLRWGTGKESGESTLYTIAGLAVVVVVGYAIRTFVTG